MGGTLDLHVLGAPLAFILSQDQTLQKKFEPRCNIGVNFAINQSSKNSSHIIWIPRTAACVVGNDVFIFTAFKM